MVFAGIQKVTLLDYPGKTACTVFTTGCDFACPFCQNASLIGMAGSRGTVPLLHRGEAEEPSPCFFDFLATRQGLLDGVCISGGEPLLQDGLESFIGKVKELGFLVKLDTNGSDPIKLRKLIESGKIDFVAMDIKNSPEKYAKTIGLPEYDISPIKESIELLSSGDVPYEFRTTVVKEFHTEDDLLSIARWIDGAGSRGIDGKYFLQKFIDSENVKQRGLHGYSDAEMRHFLEQVKFILPDAELRSV